MQGLGNRAFFKYLKDWKNIYEFMPKKFKESEKEATNKYNKSQSIQDKLTKSLLVQEWFNELVKLKYTLNKTK